MPGPVAGRAADGVGNAGTVGLEAAAAAGGDRQVHTNNRRVVQRTARDNRAAVHLGDACDGV